MDLSKVVLFCNKNNTLLSSDGQGGLMSTIDVSHAVQFSSKRVANQFIAQQDSDTFPEDYSAKEVSELVGVGEDPSSWQKLDISGMKVFAKKNGITDLKLLRGKLPHIKALMLCGKCDEAEYELNKLRQGTTVTSYP